MQCRSFPKGIFAACLAAAILAPDASAGAKPEKDDSAASQGKRQAAEGARALRTEAFRIADEDADGSLSAEEFAALPALMADLRRQRVFERLDADGDGRLMIEEFGFAAKRNSKACRPWRDRIRLPSGR